MCQATKTNACSSSFCIILSLLYNANMIKMNKNRKEVFLEGKQDYKPNEIETKWLKKVV